MRWLGLASVVGFVVAGCGGAPVDADGGPVASASAELVKCAQSRFYSLVPVQWSHLGVCLFDYTTHRYNCQTITESISADVICGNDCQRATLVCTFTDPDGNTQTTPIPNSRPESVTWDACNSANVCQDDPSHPPRPGTGLPGTNLP